MRYAFFMMMTAILILAIGEILEGYRRYQAIKQLLTKEQVEWMLRIKRG